MEKEIVQADWWDLHWLHYLCWRQETAPARRIDQYTWRFCKELLCFSCEVAYSKAENGFQTNMGPEPNLARTPTGAKRFFFKMHGDKNLVKTSWNVNFQNNSNQRSVWHLQNSPKEVHVLKEYIVQLKTSVLVVKIAGKARLLKT